MIDFNENSQYISDDEDMFLDDQASSRDRGQNIARPIRLDSPLRTPLRSKTDPRTASPSPFTQEPSTPVPAPLSISAWSANRSTGPNGMMIAPPPYIQFPLTPMYSSPRKGIAPWSPQITGAEVATIRAQHASTIAGMSDVHAREIASLRTHIDLLEKQASLPAGRHLSPSGLLPLLNTSPTKNANNRDQSATFSNMDRENTLLTKSLDESRKSHEKAMRDIDTLKASLSKKESDLRDGRNEKDMIQQSLTLKEKMLSQMKTALSRAAEAENTSKTKIVDLEARLEAANDQRNDIHESYQEARDHAGRLFDEEAMIRQELDKIRRKSNDSGETAYYRERITTLEQKVLAVEKQLTKAVEEKNIADSKLCSTRSELSTAKDRICDLEKAKLLSSASPVDYMGTITIGNAMNENNKDSLLHESIQGRIDLVIREMKNLTATERTRLTNELKNFDDKAGTALKTIESPKDKSQRSTIRHLEAERDHLSNLLSVEIRRAAKLGAKANDEKTENNDKYQMICAHAGALRSKYHDARGPKPCDEVFTKAKKLYDDEVRGLVQEIVLYKLDIKGYKKDLKKANTIIKDLRTSSNDRDRKTERTGSIAALSADAASSPRIIDSPTRLERDGHLKISLASCAETIISSENSPQFSIVETPIMAFGNRKDSGLGNRDLADLEAWEASVARATKNDDHIFNSPSSDRTNSPSTRIVDEVD